MQLDASTFLRLVEETHRLACFDIESTGLNGDYNSILVVAVKPYGRKPTVLAVDTPGDDKKLVQEAAELLSSFDCWVTYYGKGFDVPMIQSRLLYHGLPKLVKKPHVDMYFHLNAHVNTSRRSQGHRINWLSDAPPMAGMAVERGLDKVEHKMTVPANVWNRVLAEGGNSEDGSAMWKLMERCGSDSKGLEWLLRRTQHLVLEIAR